MEYTPNLSLKKPEYWDLADIEDINGNMDVLDEEVKNKADKTQVLTDVPLNAKFTDTNTTYSEISTAEIDAGTSSTLRTITGRRVKYILDKVSTMISTAISGLTKANVGLGNVDNTSDTNKPVSTATKNAIDLNSVPFVAGTQTVTTASWTGVLDTLDDIYDGLTIRYWLPITSASNVTLNLTLKGGTTTGNIPCYYSNSSRLTTHYAAGNIIVLTYVEGKLANGVSRTGWYAHAQYNTTYSEISTAEIDTGTSSTSRVITGRRVQYILNKVASMISAKANLASPTFTGTPKTTANTSYTTGQLRNIRLIAEGQTVPSLNDGEIALVYSTAVMP